MEIHGHFDEKFAAVREEFELNFTEKDDVGASFAVTIEGESVIDIWAGHRDAAKTLPWEEDTIVNVWSSTKPMYFMAALMLADRGELNLYGKVTDYWPEYGQNGKKSTEVRHFMSHSAGLPGFGEQLTMEQLCDWDYAISVLERQEPWWEPGKVAHYHAMTQGFLVGEIVRRITGKSLGTFFREEIAGPLNADFHIGVDPAIFPRVAEIIAPPPLQEGDTPEPPAELRDRINGTPPCFPPHTNQPDWRQAEIPAANGHGNARSIARIASAVANNGTVDGVTLMSPEGVERIFDEQITMDKGTLGMGYGLGALGAGAPRDSKVCLWGGAGGSTHVIDMDRKASFAYVMNQMNHDLVGGPRGWMLQRRFYESMGLVKPRERYGVSS